MTTKNKLSTTWLKASVLGCLWASSEIVLGSFLHNLRIPFAGIILTGIGIVLLISVSYSWKDKGLFWRTGFVCALLKSISPSAVIFGPMIAIFSEALLMELSVRIFRRNLFSYIIAGMLAMSWNLFHVLANYIIIYGFNIIELYVNLTKFAQKQLHIVNDNYWLPLLVLLLLYMLFGLIASITGIYIGKSAAKNPPKIINLSVAEVLEIKSRKKDPPFPFSMNWLFINILLLISSLALISFVKWEIYVVVNLTVLVIWIYRYKNSLKPVLKPRFWLVFATITILSGYLFYSINNSYDSAYKGLLIGLEMNFRAALTIIGFSTIGKELSNPKFKNIFMKSRLKNIPVALEVAFDTLPFVLANMPPLKNIFLHPVKIFHELLSQADLWLVKVEIKNINRDNVIIIKGIEKEGKSSFVKEIANKLSLENIKLGGIISPCVYENNMHSGYDIIDVASNKKAALSRIRGGEDMPNVGNYFFNKEGIEFGKEALRIQNLKQAEIVFVDEIGPWELKNQGWANSVNQLTILFEKPMIWVVRESIVEKVINNWSLKNTKIFDIKETKVETVCTYVLSLLNKKET
ncbi:MAG: nucleoside-triphosphatase [Bacteroidales bacterium]|nr:nucleoside-triphosphatase [Bacteroidales bacterium]